MQLGVGEAQALDKILYEEEVRLGRRGHISWALLHAGARGGRQALVKNVTLAA